MGSPGAHFGSKLRSTKGLRRTKLNVTNLVDKWTL